MIDPRRLETFRVVATSGSVSAAARALHLSQPAVTAQIRQLEEECGRPLFARSARGMALNAAGRALLVQARRVREALDDAEGAVQADADARGQLVLAASTTLADYVLPPLLAEFLRAHRGVGVRLQVGNTAQVLAGVKRGEAPLGMVEGHARAAGVRLEHFLDDALLAVISGDPPPELARIARLADLEAVPVIWREAGSGTRAVVERALRAAGSTRRPRDGDLELGSTEAIKDVASRGLGLAFLSRWSIRRELASGRLRALEVRGLSISRSFSWALPSRDPAGLAGLFLRHARAAAPRLGA
jgi:DNA-binding transcriptional LysR family regulator